MNFTAIIAEDEPILRAQLKTKLNNRVLSFFEESLVFLLMVLSLENSFGCRISVFNKNHKKPS